MMTRGIGSVIWISDPEVVKTISHLGEGPSNKLMCICSPRDEKTGMLCPPDGGGAPVRSLFL